MLADPELERSFRRDGFVILPDLLNRDEIDQLTASYWRLDPVPEDRHDGCFMDGMSVVAERKAAADTAVQQVLAAHVETCLSSYRPHYANYSMKWPGAASDVAPHQDPSFVDEENFTSVSIWCALDEADAENGAMWFFPGSHRMAAIVRGSNQEGSPFDDVQPEIRQRCGVTRPVNAGDAIVFDHRVLHWSYPNRSRTPRLAAVIGAVPQEAALVHYVADGDMVEAFTVDDRFFIDHSPFLALRTRPAGYRRLSHHRLGNDPITTVDLDAWLAQNPFEPDPPPLAPQVKPGPPAPHSSSNAGDSAEKEPLHEPVSPSRRGVLQRHLARPMMPVRRGVSRLRRRSLVSRRAEVPNGEW